MKKMIYLLLLVGLVGVVWQNWITLTQKTPINEQNKRLLPWNSQVQADGTTLAFDMPLGTLTLRQLSEQFRHIPEVAVFETPQGKQTLEAYLGRKRVGLFEGKWVAELAAEQSTITRFVTSHIERKPQPTGTWRYELSEADVLAASAFKVRYLIYLPVTDYSSELIQQRFGTPAEKAAVNAQLTRWLYPEKGVVIVQDNEGGEVFYYSTPADYAALKQLLTINPTSMSNERNN